MQTCSNLQRLIGAILFAVVAATGPSAPVGAATWGFDKDHTNVSFSWSHLGLSRQTARILDVEGLLEFDPEMPEQGAVEVVMRVSSIWTGNEALDKHLITPDFFNAARHPAITFRSTGVKRISDKTGEVKGDLTIMGIAKPVTLQATWNFSGEHPLAAVNPGYKDKFVSGFSAQTRILRSEWGISRGIPLASDEIEISIEAELIRR